MSLILTALAACGGESPTDPTRLVADSVTLAASRDNTLFDEAGTLSNGAGQHFLAGTTQQSRRRRALVRFDVAGAGIPPGASVDSVTLTLHMSRTNAGAALVALHRVTADWGEGSSVGPDGEGSGGTATVRDATWLHRFYDTDRWTTPGGDYVSTASAAATVEGIGPYRWGSTAALVSDVQAWLAAPASNFGWILVGDESRRTTAKRFDSHENVDAARRPRLTVHFRRPPD